MTIEQVAIEHRLGKVTEYMDPALQKKVQRELDMFKAGAQWAIEKSLDILDSMFMEQGSISVDDWFRDSKNLFQGREEFKKRMSE
jgi:hypothetical protein